MKIKNVEYNKNIRALHWYHWLVLIASLLLTLSAWYISKEQTLARQEAQLNYQAELIVPIVKDRLQVYEAALWSGVSTFHSHNLNMSHKEWSDFSNTLSIEKRLPGINGIGFIRYFRDKIEASKAEEHYQQNRPYFKIYPEHSNKESWPIVFIEPEQANNKAVGLDMAHEKNRYTAAQKAMETGSAQITGPIVLVQDSQKTPGFLFYAPLYSSKILPSTVEQRKKSLLGLVYAPFIVSKLMEGTLVNRNRMINFKIFDNDEVLYDELSEASEGFDPDPLFHKIIKVQLYGRDWVFEMQSTKLFREVHYSYQPIAILLAGILIDILLLYLFYLFATTNRKIENRVNKVTSQLRQSKQHLTHVLNNLVDGLITFDDAGNILSVNKVARSLLKADSSEIDLTSIDSIGLSLINRNNKAFFRSCNNDPIELGATCETYLCNSHKEKVPVEILIINIKDGANPYYLCSFKDISEQIAFEKALQATEHLLDTAINSSNTGFALVDSKLKLLMTNVKLNSWLGYSNHSLNGRSLSLLLSQEYTTDFLEKITNLYNSDKEFINDEVKFIDSNERTKWAMVSAAPVVNEQGGVDAIVLQATDFDKEHNLIQELSEKNLALEKSNQDLEQFAYIASHDLKSPLNAINQLAHWILEDCESLLPQASSEHLQLLIKRSQRMGQLLEDLLRYSRVSRYSFKPEQFSLKDIVYEQCELLDTPASTNIEVKDMHMTLPRTPFELVIRNILSNAIKHNDKDHVSINVNSEIKDGYYTISLADNGPGIPENLQEKVFEMFQTLKPRDTVEGSGMGLALVKRIVEHYKGNISINSVVGVGVEFNIQWPV